jgi:hypothetical protein
MATPERHPYQAANSRIWPNVDTESGAAWATKQAFWAAVIVAAVTSGMALLGANGSQSVRALGIDAWSLIDGILWVAIALGLWRQSGVAAWAGLMLIGASRVYMWSRNGVSGLLDPLVTVVFIQTFIGGIRGTSALHRPKNSEASLTTLIAVVAERPSSCHDENEERIGLMIDQAECPWCHTNGAKVVESDTGVKVQCLKCSREYDM